MHVWSSHLSFDTVFMPFVYIFISGRRSCCFLFSHVSSVGTCFLTVSLARSLFLFPVSSELVCGRVIESWDFVLFTLNPVRPDASSRRSSVMMKNVGCKKRSCRDAMLKQLDDAHSCLAFLFRLHRLPNIQSTVYRTLCVVVKCGSEVLQVYLLYK